MQLSTSPNALSARLAPVSAISIDPATPLLKKFGSAFFAVARVLPNPTAAEMPKTSQNGYAS
jgi:hypothetical protein